MERKELKFEYILAGKKEERKWRRIFEREEEG